MKPSMACLACVALTLAIVGCSHVVRSPLEREITDHMDIEKPWIEMEGWTDRNGGQHELKGYAWVTTDSVLVYPWRPQASGRPGTSAGHPTVLPAGDIALVHVRRFSLLKTSVVVLAPVAILVGAMAAGGSYSIGE